MSQEEQQLAELRAACIEGVLAADAPTLQEVSGVLARSQPVHQRDQD